MTDKINDKKWFAVYVKSRSEKKVNLAQGFHSSSKNKIHKHVQTMKYNISNLGDSANMVKALIFASKVDIEQYND